MKIIGAKITTGATVGFVFNLGGTMYMVTGRPSVIETISGIIIPYASMLATRPDPENDDVLGDDTLRINNATGWCLVSGPYNAIAALRELLPTRLAA